MFLKVFSCNTSFLEEVFNTSAGEACHHPCKTAEFTPGEFLLENLAKKLVQRKTGPIL